MKVDYEFLKHVLNVKVDHFFMKLVIVLYFESDDCIT